MPKYIISIGSSNPLGLNYIQKAYNIITNYPNIKAHGKSRILKNSSQHTKINRLFYNGAIAIFSHLEPLILYRELKTIETKLGRIRSYKNAPRTIDLDILMAFNLSYNSSTFFLPHKECYARYFFVFCAVEAIMTAGWSLPLPFFRALKRLGRNYMAPCNVMGK